MTLFQLGIVNLGACVCLGTISLFAAQDGKSKAAPLAMYGTWIWSPSSRIDPTLPRYNCYVERIDDLGNGKSRLRDHRIRETGAVVKNDYEFEFNVESQRGDGTRLFKRTGPRSYQMIFRTKGPITFVVNREISVDGRTMIHIGEGLVDGRQVRNEQRFQRSDGPSRSGDCALD